MASAEAMPVAPKSRKPTAEEIELIRSDVSSFASSLGLCLPPPLAGDGGGGFDDSDFRKTGPLKPPKYRENQSMSESFQKGKNSEKISKTEPKSKPHPLQIDPFHDPGEKKINHAKFPLMKAISLSGHWFVDAEELERRLLGAEAKNLPVMKLEELKDLVAKKKDLAERLLEQYTREYEMTRKKSGDIRLLETTARSGTSADKVSAFTCLVEDNPMASMRAFDALLCKSVECSPFY